MHAARSIADKPGLQAGHWGSLKQIPIAGGEQEVGFFPVHAMKMSDFLALEKLEPHNDLVNKGLVRPLDFAGADKNATLNFVSHQWLGYEEADPNSNHLSTMQEVFKRAIAGESIFRSDEGAFRAPQCLSQSTSLRAHANSPPSDWRAYSKGYTAVNAFSVQQTSGVVEHSGEQSDESAFRGGLRDGWVWMDYISIPQTIGCSSEEEVLRVMAEQKRAISSIPYYVQHAKNFWICAPSGAEHVDACHECNYNTWHARGWCRMEEAVFLLIRLGDGRPLLVTQPLGEPPRVKTLDRIDRAWNMTQRHTSVLTGAFSCCRLGHRVTSRDGKSTTIGCDREQLAGILERLFDEQVEKLRANFASEGGAELPFMKRVSHSMSFCHLWNFLNVKNLILADSLDEPDFVAEGWSKPFEELTQADYEAFCTTGYQGYGGFDSDPQGDLDMMVSRHQPRCAAPPHGATPFTQDRS